MTRPSRFNKRRVHLALIALAAFPFLLAPVPVAHAESAEGVEPASQGWFLDRPAPPAGVPDELGDPLSNPAFTDRAYAGDHLYVGWDGTEQETPQDKDKREFIAGINFDLSGMGVPEGASITTFVVTLLEHPAVDQTHRFVTPNRTEMVNQGILACPWPEFLAGGAGGSLSGAPGEGDRHGGKCAEGVKPSSIVLTNPAEPDNNKKVYAWTFNLTEMMNQLWQAETNTSFSLEPNAASPTKSNQLWIVAFHSSKIPQTDPTALPGVLASISWVAPIEIGSSNDFGFDTSGDSSTVSTDFPFGGEAGSSFTESWPTLADAPAGRGALVAAADRKANFWDIPILGWIAALLVVLFVVFSGFTVEAEPAGASRPPGSVRALLAGELQERIE